jgi:hypothetical protein
LALVTSLAVEIFHKGAELTLMANKSSNPVAGARLEAETFQRYNFCNKNITNHSNTMKSVFYFIYLSFF